MKEPYPKIPIPLSQRWKEFRVRLLPGVIFLIVSLIVFNLWDQRVSSATMAGKVIGLQAELRSPQAGYLTHMQTERFQYVSAGEPIAEIVTTDPRILEAQLAVVLAETEMIRLGMGPVDNRQRNLLNLEGMQMDLMQLRIQLASSNLQKQRAEREYNRVSQLFADNLVSEEEYDRVKSEYEIVSLEIEQKSEMLETMNRRIHNLAIDNRDDTLSQNPISAAIRLQEERLRLIEAELMPVTLHAPIDGMISRVYRNGGEQVEGGDTIVTIQSPNPDYIVGYLPHPIRMEPEPGMAVIVRSQSDKNLEFKARILNVGVQVEDMGEVQNLHPQTRFIQTGLPVKIGLSDNVSLRPGEIVDLTLRP